MAPVGKIELQLVSPWSHDVDVCHRPVYPKAVEFSLIIDHNLQLFSAHCANGEASAELLVACLGNIDIFMYQDGHGSEVSKSESAEIVGRIQRGDASAETEFVKRYSRSLFLLLLRHTDGDRSAANECTQETLLITLRKIRAGEIKKPRCLSVFVRQTGIYVSINYYRKQNRFVAFNKGNITYLRPQPSTAETDINFKQVRSILKEVLSELPADRDREILERYFLKEHLKKEICEELGLAPGHFDRILFRAKKRLRKILNGNKPLEAFLHSEMLDIANGYE